MRFLTYIFFNISRVKFGHRQNFNNAKCIAMKIRRIRKSGQEINCLDSEGKKDRNVFLHKCAYSDYFLVTTTTTTLRFFSKSFNTMFQHKTKFRKSTHLDTGDASNKYFPKWKKTTKWQHFTHRDSSFAVSLFCCSTHICQTISLLQRFTIPCDHRNRS